MPKFLVIADQTKGVPMPIEINLDELITQSEAFEGGESGH